jgi:predicted nucleic acid-binding protein
MSDKVFIDSNIWLYALIEKQQKNDQFKHKQAKKLLTTQDNIYISTQVVNEVCVNLIRKANKDHAYILQFSRDFIANYTVHNQTTEDIITAATLRFDYHLSYWDSLIIASAINNKCKIVYSEDMQNNLIIYNKLTILNPFI